jgi:predicted membrane-bound spermidine synthase
MLFGIFFAFWRFMEIITLIPTLGMLSYFVHLYVQANALTPDSILILFIVSVLGAVWAIATLFTYHRSKSNSLFVAFVDLCFVGAFIGAVYALRGISGDKCTTVTADNTYTASFGILGSVSYGGYGLAIDKTCAMLKACWAFGIMNCVFFFITALLALFVSPGNRKKEVYVRESHYSSRHGGGSRRSGSHRSHRSSHSGRRHAYV